MKTLIAGLCVLLFAVQFVAAQDVSTVRADAKEAMKAILEESRLGRPPFRGQDKRTGPITIEAVSVADVGEPDSFGKNALFLGIAQSGIVIIDPTCDPASTGPLGPDDHCITVADPSLPLPTTTINNVARISIPAKSALNVIYMINNQTVSFSMINTGAATTQGRFSYVPTITIESEALNDPSLIDPTTGLPYNGSFTTGGSGAYLANKTMAPGAAEFVTESYSRANTTGFSKTFFAALGLPSNVIKDLYNKPMTIKLNIRVSSRWVDSATMVYTARFLGN